MRTRLIRPSFWSDSTMARLPVAVRMTFMGLWGMADDDGYFEWKPEEIAGELYRWESPAARERHVEAHLERLVTAGPVKLLDCGRHGLIPSMREHRIQSGRHTFGVRGEHVDKCPSLRGIPRPSASSSLRNGSGSDSVMNRGDEISEKKPTGATVRAEREAKIRAGATA